MKDDKIYVSYILECVSRIEQYAGNDRDIFMKSTLIQDAIFRHWPNQHSGCQMR